MAEHLHFPGSFIPFFVNFAGDSVRCFRKAISIKIVYWQFHLTSLLLFFSVAVAEAQELASLPKLVPSYTEDFANYRSYSSMCFEDSFLDQQGRLWLMPCSFARANTGLALIQFDGYEFREVPLELKGQPSGSIRFIGLYGERELLGTAFVSKTPTAIRFFLFDPANQKLRFPELPMEGRLKAVNLRHGNQVFICMEKDGVLHFYRWTEEQWTKETSYPSNKLDTENGLYEGQIFNTDEKQVWLKPSPEPYLIRLEKENNQVRRFDLSSSKTGIPKRQKNSYIVPAISTAAGGQADSLYIQVSSTAGSLDRRLFQYDPVLKDFKPMRGIPPNWIFHRAAIDQAGNRLFVFATPEGESKALLIDTEGQRFDYSAMFPKDRFDGRPNSLVSTNFKEQIIITDRRGVLLHRVKRQAGIQYFLEGNSLRAMTQLSAQQVLVCTHGRGCFLLDLAAGITTDFSIPSWSFADRGTIFSLLTDQEGYIWSFERSGLVKYDPTNQQVEKYPLGLESGQVVMTWAGEETIALIMKQKLYLFDIIRKRLSPVLDGGGQPMEFSSRLQGLHYTGDSLLWGPTAGGLWKVDLATGESEVLGHEAPFLDHRFLSIAADDQGRLWLGTASGGLHIYDPNTGDIQILNDRNGLGNNTIASITQDEDGDRWIGTYDGISIVSPKGVLIANITDEDGLRERECNRFSALHLEGGQLLIGTINGLHLIDVDEVKKQVRSRDDLKIYLNELRCFETGNQEEVTQTSALDELEQVVLPASHRSLYLDFALSNYFGANTNQFEYKLGDEDNGWVSLGARHTLYLDKLQAGNYDLWIRGTDRKGNGVVKPIQVQIRVGEFFYRQTWFYLLVLLGSASLATLWIQRLRIEVKKATQTIRQDKELIQNQAAQLLVLDKAKSHFFTNISHEFRTPLTVINGMIEQVSGHDQVKRIVKRNSNNLLNLINQILDLRKMEVGKLEAKWVQADVVLYFQYLLESYEALADLKGGKLHFIPQEKELWMDVDKEKLLRIVSNLLSNAIKFTPEGGNIYLGLEKSEKHLASDRTNPSLKFFVRDTGVGIAQDQQDMIFNRFFQEQKEGGAQNGASGYPSQLWNASGSGIGLALTRDLVHFLDGRIEMESEEGKGTTFTIWLPIKQTAVKENVEELDIPIPDLSQAEMESLAEIEATPATALNGKGLQVLVVEDNRDVRHYLVTLLQGQYQVFIAKDGQEGADKAFDLIPDIIISDVMMPKKNGFDLCRELKSDFRTSHIPIILLTSKSSVESRIQGLKEGADAYLSKPFNHEELFVRVRMLLEVRKKLQDRYLSISNLPLAEPIREEKFALEDAFIARLKEVIEANMHRSSFAVPELCREMGVSRSLLHRKLKALTNKSTTYFMRLVRLEKARELLKDPSLNVTQVAYEVGFSDISYFSKCFTEEYGMSPKAFRERG